MSEDKKEKLTAKIVKYLYEHRWGLTLGITFLAVLIFMYLGKIIIQCWVDIDSDDKAFGTMLLAITSLPALTFVWFIKNYERTIELENKHKDTALKERDTTRKEADQLQREFNELLLIAADDTEENRVKQNIAFTQFAEYLTGRKWGANIEVNTAIIFKVISMTIDKYSQQIEGIKDEEKLKLKVDEIKNDQTIKTISYMLRKSFNKNGEYKIRISNNRLERVNLSFLNIYFINLSSPLILIRSQFAYANLDFANFHDANLLNANLNNTNLDNADLSKTNLTTVKNLENASFENAILKGTKGLPDWFDPEKPFNGHPSYQEKPKDNSPIAD